MSFNTHNDDRSVETIRKVRLLINFLPSPSGHREKEREDTGGEERLVSLEFSAGEESSATGVPERRAQKDDGVRCRPLQGCIVQSSAVWS